jgi:hypothetical protein
MTARIVPPDPVHAQLGHAAALVRVRNLEGISGTGHIGPKAGNWLSSIRSTDNPQLIQLPPGCPAVPLATELQQRRERLHFVAQ